MQTSTPLKARILLSHAYFERLARLNSIDVLHIKGYAFADDTYGSGRKSSDVDLLLRPAHVDRFMYLVRQDGWSILTHFETGSVFEHAATIYHPTWGLADVHRYFPGVGFMNPTRAFDLLWDESRTKDIAHYPCKVPSLRDARLLVVVHCARSHFKKHPDLAYLEKILSAHDWEELQVRAQEIDAEIAFDTALGKLDKHRDNPYYLMWKVISEEAPFHVQLRARLQRTPGLRNKVRLLLNILSINEDHLAMSLGRTPTKEEKRKEFFNRFSVLRKKHDRP